MRTFIITVGIILIVAFVALLWMFVAGTDESRRDKQHNNSNDRKNEEMGETDK